jgi:hypothetical protein
MIIHSINIIRKRSVGATGPTFAKFVEAIFLDTRPGG